MKKLPLFLLLVGFMANAQTPPPARMQAKPGNEVWVIGYHVQAKKRAQYERFVHDIFWAGATKLSGKDRQVLRQTRILHPTKANTDGSFTYLFIMDPVIAGADYDIESLLVKMYGKAKATTDFKLFTDALVPKSKYDEFIVTQSKD